MTKGRRRTAVLISGRGSNLQALIAASQAEDYPAEIVLVVSDNADAGGLSYARVGGIRPLIVDRRRFAGKRDFEDALQSALQDAGIELVCLAGFMRILSPALVEIWRGRMLNIHPSLLPLFPGLHTHQRAIDAGMRIAGCTVHVATLEVDAGPILAQAAVPVLPGDDEESLHERIKTVERQLLVEVLHRLVRSQSEVESEKS